MNLKNLVFASAFLFSGSLFAQDYKWDATPKIEKVADTFKNESAVFLLDKRVISYVPPAKGEDVIVYRTVHRIIKLIDDKGVEYFNKMTVSPSYGATIVQVQGRTIKPGGKAIELTKEQIKTKANERGDEQYHLAFEGVEKGDVVEMFYTEKDDFSLFGAEMLQFGLPVQHASFTLEIPSFWRFDTKGYNGFPDAKDTVIDKRRIYTAESFNLDAMEEEKYSDLTPNLQREEYKLSYVGESQAKQYTWNDMVKRMYENNYSFTEKELKAVSKFLAPLGLDKLATEEAKIIAIEAAIKKDIVYDEKLRGQDYLNMNFVLEKKTASEAGIIRLFVACFQANGIKHELGISSNRFELPVDPAFENWHRCDMYVFYFPKTQQYLDPVATTLRYPMILAAVRENNAVFCKITTVGSLTSAIASIRKIPQLDLSQSANALNADISFDKNMVPELKMIQGFTGFSAVGIREAVTLITKDKEKDLVVGLSGGIIEKPEDIVSYKFNNGGLEHYTDNKPVEISAEFKADKLMETAGNKWLFKVGDVIGPQEQMYNDKKRRLPISYPYPHAFPRTLVIHIPDGYKIENPDAVKKDIQVPSGKMAFHSSYTIDGNTMTVTINEFYTIDYLPASEIEIFKDVVNASADFNKVTLILAKK